jgi:di/tricarboxylate transporter
MPITSQIIFTLTALTIGSVFFAVNKFSAELVAIALVVSLVVFGVITKEEAFSGLGSETVVMIFGLLVLTAGLERTGVVEIVGRQLTKHCRDDPRLLLLMVMCVAMVLSAFISNTAATAFFLPIVFGTATRLGKSPSRFLLPLAFSSILSSSVTLISTSTNIVVSELIEQRGMKPLGFFELAPVGIPIAIIGLLYMWFIGQRLLPEEENRGQRGRIRPTTLAL